MLLYPYIISFDFFFLSSSSVFASPMNQEEEKSSLSWNQTFFVEINCRLYFYKTTKFSIIVGHNIHNFSRELIIVNIVSCSATYTVNTVLLFTRFLYTMLVWFHCVGLKWEHSSICFNILDLGTGVVNCTQMSLYHC